MLSHGQVPEQTRDALPAHSAYRAFCGIVFRNSGKLLAIVEPPRLVDLCISLLVGYCRCREGDRPYPL